MTGVENNIIEVGLIDYLVNGRPRGPDERSRTLLWPLNSEVFLSGQAPAPFVCLLIPGPCYGDFIPAPCGSWRRGRRRGRRRLPRGRNTKGRKRSNGGHWKRGQFYDAAFYISVFFVCFYSCVLLCVRFMRKCARVHAGAYFVCVCAWVCVFVYIQDVSQ